MEWSVNFLGHNELLMSSSVSLVIISANLQGRKSSIIACHWFGLGGNSAEVSLADCLPVEGLLGFSSASCKFIWKIPPKRRSPPRN
ncbi:hypothetical protein CEXT_794211 [Caerostris extrusa]|uniref:Uncharacterized protein n=1 Tax=Caerostris extrusa TaxID=172846 RepID=A0AAV4SPD7_CAEEX|nr:hypothetical protein CEXT_794211 [Caerostris extrusa]